jgi:hypothetical protein
MKAPIPLPGGEAQAPFPLQLTGFSDKMEASSFLALCPNGAFAHLDSL